MMTNHPLLDRTTHLNSKEIAASGRIHFIRSTALSLVFVLGALASGQALSEDGNSSDTDEEAASESSENVLDDNKHILVGDHVSLQFVSPIHFRDFKSETFPRATDQERLMRFMLKNMDRSVRRSLPDGHRLELTITDIDMAGEIIPSVQLLSEEQRVIRRMYPPKIKFSFVWYDETGKKIISGEEERKELDVERLIRRIHRGEMAIEQAMLDRWLRELARFWKKNYAKAEDENDQ